MAVLGSDSPRPAEGAVDIVADRHRLLQIGMAAVWVACFVFAIARLLVTLRTGTRTPWWANAAGLLAITALYLWYRRRPQARSEAAAHGTALVATVALLAPIAYGMSSTIWWLSLVGFATVLLGRPREAKVWGVAIPLLVVASVIAEPYVQVGETAGEPLAEAALAKVIFVVILLGMAVGFRRVAEERARSLHESQAEVSKLKDEFEARALSGEGLAARRLLRLEHLNAVLFANRNISQLIAREDDPQRLIEQACEMLVTARGYRGAWIGLEGPDGSVARWAQSGWGKEFDPLAAVLGQGQWPPCAELAHQSTGPAVVEPERACQTCPLRDPSAGRREAVASLRHGERTYGVLGVSFSAQLAIDDEENSLIADVAGDLAFALHDLEARAERREAEQGRAAAERMLRESEERYRTLFDDAREGIALADAETGRLEDCNAALCHLVEKDRSELIGQPQAVLHPLQPLVAGLSPTFVEHQAIDAATILREELLSKSGRRIPVEITAAHVLLGGRKFLLGVFRDVTDKARMEALQANLAQADRLSSMGMLAAGVAHEINNPLSYVLHNIESLSQDLPELAAAMMRSRAALLARVGPDVTAEILGDADRFFEPGVLDDAVERLRDALSGTERIKAITRSLGTFSRVESVDVRPVSIQACVEHAATMAFNELKYRARFTKDFSPVPPVLASDGKLSQVFLNLIINAAHAVGEGHVDDNEVRVRTWSEGDMVLAEVSDTGTGIAPEHRARIFEPFFTTKGPGVGSGLGLSICKRIIEDFGGTLSFTSELGRGTSFRICLPRAPADRAEGRDKGGAPAAPSPAIRGRILVVDDEPGIRSAIVRILKADHEVVTAASGAEGRALLDEDGRFDVIFCDLMMPGMSGMELHAWLAQRDPELARQVVFITGGAFTPGASEYLQKVGNLRIDKPFDIATFRRIAGELVATARAKRG